jgi:hypothetical protein
MKMAVPPVPKQVKEVAKGFSCKIYVGKSKLLLQIDGGNEQIKEAFIKAFANSLAQVSKTLGIQKVEVISGG